MLSVPNYKDDIRMSGMKGSDIGVCSTATQQIVKLGTAPQFGSLFCYDRSTQIFNRETSIFSSHILLLSNIKMIPNGYPPPFFTQDSSVCVCVLKTSSIFNQSYTFVSSSRCPFKVCDSFYNNGHLSFRDMKSCIKISPPHSVLYERL